ncbi:uncharacterized protein BCR38DRAFT_450752 [Pseudomassariella vexata]|uniref:Uncharacterized protein n=1 Tax=Pseudomassariella vexata TaxID=1141098 RepID=A0A1Y2DBH3_9PEZI|nr:uncharacterized protein BCR38DRAFT_450752 [Pseudomassariella vexata]ORY56623.1 hypothetical protein BCR38DRAFT_450752 [Pseudomassariella vexata]
MLPATDNHPFLKYSDDDPTIDEANCSYQYGRDRTEFFKHRWSSMSPLLSHSLVFILSSFLWILVIIFTTPSCSANHPTPSQPATNSPSTPHNLTTHAHLTTCGNSTAEARAAGCKYDILINNWVHPACIDQESIDEYQEDGTWQGYTDLNRTQQLPSIEAMSEVDFYYTSTRDHIVHCNMLWRKQFKAFFDEKSFDAVIGSFGHTEHCSQFLIDVTDKYAELWEEPIRTEVGFSGCWVRD